MHWRFALLAGGSAGLAAAPLLALPPGAAPRMLVIAASAAFVAVAARPVARPGLVRGGWVAGLAACAALAGLAGGTLRIAAIDSGALRPRDGAPVQVRGFVAAVPKRREGNVRVLLSTAEGRILLSAPEPVPDLEMGVEVAARGVPRPPGDWERSYLERLGVARVLEARTLRLTGMRRGGVAGFVDGIRSRAEAALGRGTPEPEAALVRGFVLGEDDRIDAQTVEEFQRAGLAHLLAVSGQNVVLLALLAGPILSLLGVPLRLRLLLMLGLIAVYVPVTGAGPSIQRAGIMGAAGIVATLAGRPQSRWYALLLAAFVTLALNPLAAGDAGWQLSFAAVAGIALWAAPLARLLSGSARAGSVRAAIAEGAAVTVAATVATAPLMAHDFEAVSVAALPANLLALPAVAPVMWLGMLGSVLGQAPGVPVEPLSGLAGLLAAYVAQVAHWFSQPGWAQVAVSLPGAGGVLAAYAALAAAVGSLLALARRRRGLRAPRLRVAVALAGLIALILAAPRGTGPAQPTGLRITVIDVGQGDAIALDPPHGEPVLVDGGPPGDDIQGKLRGLGIDRLAAAIVTHDQLDHAGGVAEMLGSFPVDRLVYARAGRSLLGEARAAGVPRTQLAGGSEIDSGALRLEALWPPRSRLDDRGVDPNTLALVLLARWRGFSMLLTADAEAAEVPVDPGPVDVLKVAHHGSEDDGLPALLEAASPSLAVISVGAGNPYGHPAPPTLSALAEAKVPLMRTDLDGDVTIDVTRGGWAAH